MTTKEYLKSWYEEVKHDGLTYKQFLKNMKRFLENHDHSKCCKEPNCPDGRIL